MPRVPTSVHAVLAARREAFSCVRQAAAGVVSQSSHTPRRAGADKSARSRVPGAPHATGPGVGPGADAESHVARRGAAGDGLDL